MSQTEKALADIDRVLSSKASEVSMSQRHQNTDWNGKKERSTRLESCILRYAKPGSAYVSSLQKDTWKNIGDVYVEGLLTQVLAGLRADIADGLLVDFESEIATNTLNGLLDQADQLNQKKYVRAAAGLAGAALEEHLHFLCERHNVPLQSDDGKRFQASKLNQDLKRAGVYGASPRDQVDTWQKVRNRAVHPRKNDDNEFEEDFDKRKIDRMIEGIKDFIGDGYESLTLFP